MFIRNEVSVVIKSIDLIHWLLTQLNNFLFWFYSSRMLSMCCVVVEMLYVYGALWMYSFAIIDNFNFNVLIQNVLCIYQQSKHIVQGQCLMDGAIFFLLSNAKHSIMWCTGTLMMIHKTNSFFPIKDLDLFDAG